MTENSSSAEKNTRENKSDAQKIEVKTKQSKPEKPPAPKPKADEVLKQQEKEIADLNEEMGKLRNDYIMSIADKENLRKRLEREKQDFYQYALSEVLKDFLDVLDNFERALSFETDENNRGFREGVEMIYRQLMDTLKKQGVNQIEIKGNHFDPTVQQAFSSEEHDDVSEPTVAEVLQKGYRHHDRLLRPVLVKVYLPKK